MVENMLQSVLRTLQQRQQLQALLRKTNTMVVFSTEEENWHLFLSNKETHTTFTDKGLYRVTVFGTKDSINEAISGQAPLRQLQKLNKIKLQGNYRQILLLEALLLLSKNINVV